MAGVQERGRERRPSVPGTGPRPRVTLLSPQLLEAQGPPRAAAPREVGFPSSSAATENLGTHLGTPHLRKPTRAGSGLRVGLAELGLRPASSVSAAGSCELQLGPGPWVDPNVIESHTPISQIGKQRPISRAPTPGSPVGETFLLHCPLLLSALPGLAQAGVVLGLFLEKYRVSPGLKELWWRWGARGVSLLSAGPPLSR